MLFEPCGDGPKILEFVEEALDEIAITVEEGAERWDAHAARHWLDVRPGTLTCDVLAQGVAVIGSIGKNNLAGLRVSRPCALWVRGDIGAPDDLPLVKADAAEPASLRSMCERVAVIITTVGPYQLFGPGLVAACAATGTAYVDLCGEAAWMRGA